MLLIYLQYIYAQSDIDEIYDVYDRYDRYDIYDIPDIYGFLASAPCKKKHGRKR